MFSEYASRFLSQSRSRLSDFVGNEATGDTSTRRPEWQSRMGRNQTRSYLQANPYNPSGSRFGNLPFASRAGGRHDAPLFHSTLDEFREEEDEEERGRDAADLYALQHSRRVFAAGRLEESTEDENELSRASIEDSRNSGSHLSQDRGLRLGIRSSWKGTRSNFGARRETQETARLLDGTRDRSDSDESKGKMVDIGLESTIMNEPPADLTAEVESSPPPFQKFRDQNPRPRDSSPDPELGIPRRSSISSTDEPGGPAAEEPPSNGDLFKYDTFFAWLYIVAIASLFATFLLVWLHTMETGRPKGDTIYTALRASFHLLAVDTLVAVVVSILWLGALRSFIKPLVGLVVVAVPIIMLSFSLYPFISSFKDKNGKDRDQKIQDIAMRWSSLVPAIGVVLWFYLIHRSRHAIKQAIEILEFSTKILAANPALILAGMGTLVLVVTWTWVWLVMFTRVFLGGHLTAATKFIINASSWWLAIYFVLTYLWTLSVISGVQRGTTAATVSQWYFHRNVQPAPSSRDIVAAAFIHSVTTIFGSICEATLLALLIRLPLLILPRRVGNIVQMFAYSCIPTPIATLTNPLTITYAGIHSQALVPSARGLTEMDFLSPNAPTTTLTPRAFAGERRHSVPLLPYRLAKLLLHATRFIMAIALGFAGWVMTARQLKIDSLSGSAYAYVVGLVASFIGWGVLGAMEGVLSGIVDGVVVCYGSERRMASGQGGYCYEAAVLFGDNKGAIRNTRRESNY